MKITTSNNGKTQFSLTETEWKKMGQKAGWITEAQSETEKHAVKVIFEDGNTLTSNINGTKEEIRNYYIGQSFNFGDTDEHPADKMLKAIDVEFLY